MILIFWDYEKETEKSLWVKRHWKIFVFQENPPSIISKEEKSNLRCGCKRFSIENGEKLCKNCKVVELERKQHWSIVHDIHGGTGASLHFKAVISHGKVNAHILFGTVVRNKKVK